MPCTWSRWRSKGREVCAEDFDQARNHRSQQIASTADRIHYPQQVDHPFIATLFASFQTSTHVYFLMEYCEGAECTICCKTSRQASQRGGDAILRRRGAAGFAIFAFARIRLPRLETGERVTSQERPRRHHGFRLVLCAYRATPRQRRAGQSGVESRRARSGGDDIEKETETAAFAQKRFQSDAHRGTLPFTNSRRHEVLVAEVLNARSLGRGGLVGTRNLHVRDGVRYHAVQGVHARRNL